MLNTTPDCAHRFANLEGFCFDRETTGFWDLQCAGRRSTSAACVAHTATASAVHAPAAVVRLTASRKWSHGSLRRAVEAALGGRKAFFDAAETAKDKARIAQTEDSVRASVRADVGPWCHLRVGALSFRARLAIHRTPVLNNRYSAVEVSIPGVAGNEPHWYNMAALANASE